MSDRNKNIIINDIMSARNNTSIVLTKSDPNRLSFFNDLVKNFRASYVVNALHDGNGTLAYMLADLILENTPGYERLQQFAVCQMDYSHDIIIIKEICEYIKSLKCSCLLAVCGFEKIVGKQNLIALEYFFKNCPPNLKIVIVSDVFPEINYNMFMYDAPKLIVWEQVETESIGNLEKETEPSKNAYSVLYNASRYGFLDGDFVSSNYEEEWKEILPLIGKYKSVFFKERDMLYGVGEDLKRIAEKNTENTDRKEREYDEKFLSYFSKQSNRGKLIALEKAFFDNNDDAVNEIVKKFIEEKSYVYKLYAFAKNLNGKKSNVKERTKNEYSEYFDILIDAFSKKDYVKSKSEMENLLKRLPQGSKLEEVLIIQQGVLPLSGNRKNDSMAKIRDYFEKIYEENKNEPTKIADYVAHMRFYGDMSSDAVFIKNFQNIEKVLSAEKYKNENWYVSALKTFAFFNKHIGNYKESVKYLNMIKEAVPYYIPPNDVIGAYLFSGEIEKAKVNAEYFINSNKMMKTAKYNIINAYSLLALVDFYSYRNGDALEKLNSALEIEYDATEGEDAACKAKSIMIMLCATLGMKDYVRDIIYIFIKHYEAMNSKFIANIYAVASVCYWQIGEKEKGVFYAKKAVLNASVRSAIWLMAMGTIINSMIEQPGEDAEKLKEIVSKFFLKSQTHGMEMILVLFEKHISEIINYAKNNGIENEYIEKILSMIKKRKEFVKEKNECVEIAFMGNTSVRVAGKEIVWKTRKAKELFLMYVFCGKKGLSRNDIVKNLWQEYTYTSALNNLKTTNTIIRNTLSAYEVGFDIKYVNSKYVLKLDKMSTDYDEYRQTILKIKEEKDIRRKLAYVSQATFLYGDGFAADISSELFASNARQLKEELCFLISDFAKELSLSGYDIEANRLNGTLARIQSNK